jgi:hypothetical protein
MENLDDLTAIFGEILSAYPRAHAIVDGTLIDVTAQAAEAGFKVPVALAAAAWAKVVAWTDEDSARQTIRTSADACMTCCGSAGAVSDARVRRERRVSISVTPSVHSCCPTSTRRFSMRQG